MNNIVIYSSISTQIEQMILNGNGLITVVKLQWPLLVSRAMQHIIEFISVKLIKHYVKEITDIEIIVMVVINLVTIEILPLGIMMYSEYRLSIHLYENNKTCAVKTIINSFLALILMQVILAAMGYPLITLMESKELVTERTKVMLYYELFIQELLSSVSIAQAYRYQTEMRFLLVFSIRPIWAVMQIFIESFVYFLIRGYENLTITMASYLTAFTITVIWVGFLSKQKLPLDIINKEEFSICDRNFMPKQKPLGLISDVAIIFLKGFVTFLPKLVASVNILICTYLQSEKSNDLSSIYHDVVYGEFLKIICFAAEQTIVQYINVCMKISKYKRIIVETAYIVIGDISLIWIIYGVGCLFVKSTSKKFYSFICYSGELVESVAVALLLGNYQFVPLFAISLLKTLEFAISVFLYQKLTARDNNYYSCYVATEFVSGVCGLICLIWQLIVLNKANKALKEKPK